MGLAGHARGRTRLVRPSWVVRGRDQGPPKVINAWLALSDVTSRHSTMVVVPRRLDHYFPRSLRQAPDEHLGVQLTARLGEAIFWDALVFHWGSQSHVDAVGPRISCSYTSSPRFDPSARGLPQYPGSRPTAATHRRWVRTYGHLDQTITPVILEWADRWSAAEEAPTGTARERLRRDQEWWTTAPNGGAFSDFAEGIAHRGRRRRIMADLGGTVLVHAQFATTLEAVHERQPTRHVRRSWWLVADARIDNRPNLASPEGEGRAPTRH